jgi:uncharacterized protein
MRRPTAHAEQMKRMYATDDGRLQGPEPWQKLPCFWFHLFLSYRCTRNCAYCYSFNQVGADNQAEMDERTFARLLEWIPEVWRLNNVKVNAVGFLGGEPLLRTDRIKKVMDAVYAATDGMQGFLYTNGDPVDSVRWDDLEDVQWISTNITDVGLDELARRMKVVRERSNVINQTVVATLDDFNLERILDVSRFGLEHGYRLRFYRDLYRGLDSGYRRRLLRKYHVLCDLLETYVVRGYDVHTTFLFDTLIPLWTDESSPYLCGKRAAAVYPDGTIGPCLRNHTFKSGTIFDENPLAALECDTFHYDLGRPGLPDECRSCDCRAVCQGGCPNDKLLLTGTTSGRSVVCEIHREIIPRLRRLEELKRDRQSGRGGERRRE